MSRLEDAAIVTLVWSEDEEDGTVYAEGHQSYEIDMKNEIAIFVNNKCIGFQEAANFPHAASIVLAHEAVCAFKIRDKQQ